MEWNKCKKRNFIMIIYEYIIVHYESTQFPPVLSVDVFLVVGWCAFIEKNRNLVLNYVQQ